MLRNNSYLFFSYRRTSTHSNGPYTKGIRHECNMSWRCWRARFCPRRDDRVARGRHNRHDSDLLGHLLDDF